METKHLDHGNLNPRTSGKGEQRLETSEFLCLAPKYSESVVAILYTRIKHR